MPNSLDNVGATGTLYQEQALAWEKIHDLLGGTEAMRAAGNKWLPREPDETSKSYELRLSRTFLFNKFARTISNVVGDPFSESVKLDNAPPWVEEMALDVDRRGTTLTQFARGWMKDAAKYGRAHVFVDFPKIPENATRADELRGRPRPTFQRVTPPNLIAWRTEVDEVTGEDHPVHIRWTESRIELAGDYIDKRVDYVRVVESVEFQLWKRRTEDSAQYDLVPEESGSHTLGVVPLVTINFDEDSSDPFVSVPPFDDLAWANIEHWQSSSDQRNVLRYSRCGVLFLNVPDMQEEKLAALPVVIGVNQCVKVGHAGADMKHVGYQGEGIAAGERDLKRIEENMETLGAEPFTRKVGVDFASLGIQRKADAVKLIKAWVREVEGGLRRCFEYAAMWRGVGEELPEEFSVNVFSDFEVSAGADDMATLDAARARGDLSLETYLNELRRRGKLAETVDVEDEMRRIENEGPALGEIGRNQGDEGDGDEAGSAEFTQLDGGAR